MGKLSDGILSILWDEVLTPNSDATVTKKEDDKEVPKETQFNRIEVKSNMLAKIITTGPQTGITL